MTCPQIFKLACFLLAVVGTTTVAIAQSKRRDNPTPLTANVISGVVDSDTRGNYYFYSFTANPGEVSITLTVQPGKPRNESSFINTTNVSFSLYDRNAAEIAGKQVSTSDDSGPKQAVARVDVTRRQILVLAVYFRNGYYDRSVGGEYRIQIDGTVELAKNGSDSATATTGDIANTRPTATTDDVDRATAAECLPKRGIIVFKMKDGSVKRINLTQTKEVRLEP